MGRTAARGHIGGVAAAACLHFFPPRSARKLESANCDLPGGLEGERGRRPCPCCSLLFSADKQDGEESTLVFVLIHTGHGRPPRCRCEGQAGPQTLRAHLCGLGSW
ncbi:unnamed protein product [Rangifer tarandus platyrhynchus]|uniref:Uncharacterized protein n=2 Tax=Rangifer tarandus platyrhynchus TaxID=3082113 RepID=A0AC59YJH2_RANTA|nr:unnamed protein product [Rangifer tarandus platyrhynchus]